MDRTVATASAVALAVILTTAAVATAHGNHATVGPQVVDDSVVVEDLFVLEGDALLVVHRDDGGDIGDPVGSVALRESGPRVSVSIPVDLDLGDRPVLLWAVLHDDTDADGEYNPDEDPPLTPFGAAGVAASQFRVVGGDPVHVAQSNLQNQPIEDAVTVDRVAVDGPTHLVVQESDAGAPGAVVGNVSLDAGVHRNVSVPVDDSVFADRPRATLWASLYADDGDDRFDDNDTPITVGPDRVMTRVGVRDATDENGSLVVTAAPATKADGASDPPRTTTAGTDTDATGSPVSGPGVVPGFAVVAVALAVVVVVFRRR
jgi:hypothetical protein